MVFVKRKIETDSTEESAQDKKEQIEEQPKFPQKSQEQIRNFREQACLVLNILEEQGIDIYDTSRRPDMYIRKRQGKASDVHVQHLTQASKPTEKKQEISGSLLAAMLKK